MIKDAETGETYHPSTYYVFEDDEPDVLTTAALHALEAGSPNAIRDAEAKALIDGTAREEERYVFINMGQDGTNVAGARSLAPSWAVTNAHVRSAPTFDDGEGGDSDGLMLMVEGVGSGMTSVTKTKTSKERQDQAIETFEEASRHGAGNTISAMENIAQGMVVGLRTLDMIATAD
jgi:arginine/ornithine N-succinyltransferase beta subunit